jgi:hypothetical protein
VGIYIDLLSSLSQVVTGRILTDTQIRSISSSLVGQLFSDWLAEPKDQREIRQRVDAARDHMANATRILADLKSELDEKSSQLDKLAADVEAQRKKAEEYSILAQANASTVQAIRTQIEASVRQELENQTKRGRKLRQAISVSSWVISLLVGAALGAHWTKVEEWLWRVFQ